MTVLIRALPRFFKTTKIRWVSTLITFQVTMPFTHLLPMTSAEATKVMLHWPWDQLRSWSTTVRMMLSSTLQVFCNTWTVWTGKALRLGKEPENKSGPSTENTQDGQRSQETCGSLWSMEQVTWSQLINLKELSLCWVTSSTTRESGNNEDNVYLRFLECICYWFLFISWIISTKILRIN